MLDSPTSNSHKLQLRVLPCPTTAQLRTGSAQSATRTMFSRPNKRAKHPKDSVIAQYTKFIANSKLDENGNPFMETIVPAKSNPDWTRLSRRRPTLRPRPQEINEEKLSGAPSLHCLARRVLNRHIEDFTVEMLRSVSWVIMKTIWEDALNTYSSRDSFLVWSTFASVYGDESNFLCHSKSQNGGPDVERIRIEKLAYTIPLASIADPISNCHGKWIVYLNLLYNKGYTRDELLCIPEIPNLGILSFPFIEHDHGTSLDDGIIRLWARSSARDGKLSKLKVLILRNHVRVTPQASRYLSWIKGLEVVELTGCCIWPESYNRVDWILDKGLSGDLGTASGVLEVMRDCQTGAEKEKLVLQIGDNVNRSSSEHLKNICILRRLRKPPPDATKRKGDEEKPSFALPAKKSKGVRDSKKKGVGDLLAEFGNSPKDGKRRA